MNDFEKMVIEQRDELFKCVALRGFDADEIDRIHRAYYLAEEAHRPQRRKSGEPYIIYLSSMVRRP